MSKRAKTIIIGIVILGVLSIMAYELIPNFRVFINNQLYAVQKADDQTSYETRKQVENTARAMIASYEADVAVYTQYKSSDNEERQSWAEQAKMRANRTVATYNNYILKNSYIWEGNIPSDIYYELQLVE
jgi:hypothetical protein